MSRKVYCRDKYEQKGVLGTSMSRKVYLGQVWSEKCTWDKYEQKSVLGTSMISSNTRRKLFQLFRLLPRSYILQLFLQTCPSSICLVI